jgi:hypothetical protein
VVEGDRPDFRARVVLSLNKAQQPADLIKRESQFPTAADKGEALQVRLLIGASAANSSRWRWHQTNALVIPNRLDVAVR